MPRDHHFISSDAVQRGARHGLNSNLRRAADYSEVVYEVIEGRPQVKTEA